MDVKQEKRVDDYCNVDMNRHLLDLWTGFTKLKRETSQRIHVVRETDKDSNNDTARSCVA